MIVIRDYEERTNGRLHINEQDCLLIIIRFLNDLAVNEEESPSMRFGGVGEGIDHERIS